MSNSVDPTSELREQIRDIVVSNERWHDSYAVEDATDELLALFKKSQKQIGWWHNWRLIGDELFISNEGHRFDESRSIRDGLLCCVPVYINESVRQEGKNE